MIVSLTMFYAGLSTGAIVGIVVGSIVVVLIVVFGILTIYR